MSRLEHELGQSEGRKRYSRIFVALVVFSALCGIAGGIAFWTVSGLPKIKALEEYTPIESSRVYSADGKVLAEFYLERRTYVPYYQIPGHVKKAFISVEDIRFYYHPGVDLIGIFRALWHDIRAGGIVEGGSTITQQLARMLFLASDKSLKRKINEAVLSIQIERQYTKDEILGLYLNQAYFGARTYGIEAASQAYFGKTVNELTVGEAALLASLPKAPSVYSPFRDPKKAMERRTLVLKQMLDHKFISRAEFQKANAEALPVKVHMRKYESPFFIEYLRQGFESKYGQGLYTSGYRIYSTLDHRMQKIAEEAIRNGIEAIEKRVRQGVQASLIAIDPRTGHIRAMTGGVDFWENQFNRATQARRQTGSAFKPFVYLTAFNSGMRITDTVLDAPVSFRGGRPGQMWSPKNYDGEYHGMVTLKTALAHSLNTATVRLASRLGIANVIETANSLGIKSTLQPYLSTALGASDLTLIETVCGYAAFATGRAIEPISYERILNRDGTIIDETVPVSKEVISQDVIAEMKIALGAVIQEGTAQRAKELKRQVYGKTGTTNDYTDAWFIGFDDSIVVGVWVGRDDHTPIGAKETGSMAALPIWIEFMKKAPQQNPSEQNP
jgi:penicillin-binding protein 1A